MVIESVRVVNRVARHNITCEWRVRQSRHQQSKLAIDKLVARSVTIDRLAARGVNAVLPWLRVHKQLSGQMRGSRCWTPDPIPGLATTACSAGNVMNGSMRPSKCELLVLPLFNANIARRDDGRDGSDLAVRDGWYPRRAT